MMVSARMPLEMKTLVPLSTNSSPSGIAVVEIAARSLPAPGSVIAIAPIASPATMGASQRSFCSSVARAAK